MQRQIFEIPKPLYAFYRPRVMGTKGAVNSNSFYASRAGLDILAKGGNAADAAVAVSLVLGVVEPYHCGIGGGCFSIYYDAKSKKTITLDARGIAPKRAHKDLFIGPDGSVDESWTQFNGKTVTTPGLYRALDRINKEFGTMSMAELSEPAIKLARNGFSANFMYETSMDHPLCQHAEEISESFKTCYMNHGKRYSFGEVVRNPKLADTMEVVARKGVCWFYNGEIANRIVECVKKNDGVLEKDDLTDYAIKERPFVKGSFMGYDLISMAPPSSGGAHLIQMLNILENYDLKKMGYNSADYLHILCETIKLMFADRSEAMGDPAFVDVDVDRIISKEYAKECVKRIRHDMAQDYCAAEGLAARVKEYDGNTSHFSIIDKDGNMISQTQTIRSYWGSGIMCDGYGFILNNCMSDFSAKEGTLTTQGLTYGEANSIQGGKTPLSSMTPTLIFKDGKPFMSCGAAGGPRIIIGTLQLILNILVFDMSPDEALKASYINCITEAQGVEYEPGISPDTVEELKKRGHNMAPCRAGQLLSTMVNGVQTVDGTYYVTGNHRHDGCGGVLMTDNRMSFDGIVML